MKKIICLLIGICLTATAMGQEVIDGVYQGSPKSFMYLPTTPPGGNWSNSWVKPKRYDNGNFSGGSDGAWLGAYYTHRFIVTQDSTVSPADDNCFKWMSGTVTYNMPILANAWNSDLYPGTYVDTVIQMGGPREITNSGLDAQEILYSFVPDTNNPVLLLQFAFVTENALHESHAPVNPGVEFVLLNHGTNDILPIGNYDDNHSYAQFWFGTPVGQNQSEIPDPRNTPLSASASPQKIPKGDCFCFTQEIFTFPYTIVAFDLSNQARNHQAVDFRVREWACHARAHWAYCYFTAKMVPAQLKVKYCGGDTLYLSVPWGLDENTYQWYNGTDSASTQNTATFQFNPEDQTSSVVVPGSTKYRPILIANPEKPYYRCVAESYTGVPFTYQATVNFYIFKPSFTVEAKALTESRNCDLEIILHNTSQIGIITPSINGGLDTVWRGLDMNPELCTWNFGDGTPEMSGFEPSHTYSQPGDYTITLQIADFERVCLSPIVDTTIIMSSEYVENQFVPDSVSTCENRLPYYYKPDIFGYDNSATHWGLSDVGNHQVNYKNALPQYNIRAWNGCDSIAKVRFEVLTPTVTIQQKGDFCDSAQTTLIANVSNAQENTVEYTWTYMDMVMGNSNEMLALSDGTYSVSIVDHSTECKAEASYRIEPCMPNLFLPNCITPTHSENDGPVQNNYFYLDQLVLGFISDVKFVVYSRNGEEIVYYEGKKNQTGDFLPPTPYGNLSPELDGHLVLWDGKINGKVMNGTYVYLLWIVSGGRPSLYKGKLTVL